MVRTQPGTTSLEWDCSAECACQQHSLGYKWVCTPFSCAKNENCGVTDDGIIRCICPMGFMKTPEGCIGTYYPHGSCLYILPSWKLLVHITLMEAACTYYPHGSCLYILPSWQLLVHITLMAAACTCTLSHHMCHNYVSINVIVAVLQQAVS